MTGRFPKGYLEFESEMLASLEEEFQRTKDEGLRTLILMTRQILEIYWERKEPQHKYYCGIVPLNFDKVE